jgi:hypothetical protein
MKRRRVSSRSKRFLFFTIAILLGAVLGMLYGWLINPVRYVDTAPDMLRADYKADYVLMVAEVYAKDGDLAMAQFRLARLGTESPLQIAQSAILTAKELGYSQQDLQKMAQLSEALLATLPQSVQATP